MSCPGRPTLRQPVDRNTSRVRQDGAAGPSCATQSIERECPSSGTAKMSGGNAGNAGNLQFLGNSGLFDPAAKRRKSAEIGGNPLQRLCSRNCPQFCCLTLGVHSKPLIGGSLAEIAEIPCRNLAHGPPVSRLATAPVKTVCANCGKCENSPGGSHGLFGLRLSAPGKDPQPGFSLPYSRRRYSAASGVGAIHWSKSRKARALSACLRSLPRKAPSIGGNRPKLTFIGWKVAASAPPVM